jgi:hypothetical protein
VKRFGAKIKQIKPVYLIPAVVVVVAVLIVVGVFVIGGGGGGSSDEPDAALGIGEGSKIPGQRPRRVRQAPRVRIGTVDEARREGRLAVAQARGTIVEPFSVRIRVGAEPPQTVTVNWVLGCYKDRRAKVGRGHYRARVPDIRHIELPIQGAKSCIATASAQLTRNQGRGRVKVTVVSG